MSGPENIRIEEYLDRRMSGSENIWTGKYQDRRISGAENIWIGKAERFNYIFVTFETIYNFY
jgi:hypothetical protein